MPQLQYDYDYYENDKSMHKANKTRSTTKSGRSSSRVNTVSNTVIEANRASIRAVINSDDELFVRRAPTQTKNNRTVSNQPKQNQAVQPQNSQKKTVSNKKKVTNQTTKKLVDKESARIKKSVSSQKVSAPKKAENKKIAKKANKSSKKQVAKRKIEKPKEMSLKNAEVMVNPNTKAKMIAEKRHHTLRTVMYSVFAFSILFLICYRSSIINESFKSVNKMKNELENTKTVNAQIESEIQTQTDLSNIETYAKYQLGMQKPKESQIRKVVVAKEDKIATPVVVDKEEENSFWKSLWNDIKNILD